MDPLSWILFSWLIGAGVVFFILQKLVEFWPENLGGVGASVSDSPVEKTGAGVKREASFLNKIQSVVSTAAASVRDAANNARAEAQAITTKKSTSCEWVNELITWLFSQYRGTPICVSVWLKSLNESAKKVANNAGCEVLFEEIIEDSCSSPQVTNLRAEHGPRDHMTIRGSFYCQSIGVRLVSSQKLPDRLLVSNYDVTINELRGEMQLRIACIANELFLMGCFHGRPEMTMNITNTDSATVDCVDANCVEEAVRQCIVAAVTNLNLSGLQLKEDISGQKMAYSPNLTDIPDVDHVYSKINTVTPVQSSLRSNNLKGEQLLVKVLQAHKLGSDEGAPYVVVELDDPSQKHTTTLSSAPNPSWDEQFMFDLNSRSEEILFEVYGKLEDGREPLFLGLAIVGIDELRHSSMTTHTLTLQARPYRNDPVEGVLVTEFQFFNAEFDIGRMVDIRKENYAGVTTTNISTSAKRPLVSNYQDFERDELERDHKVTPVKTTSVLVKSVSQYFQAPPLDEAQAQLKQVAPSSPQLQVVTVDHETRVSPRPTPSPNSHQEPQLARSNKRASVNLDATELNDSPSPSNLQTSTKPNNSTLPAKGFRGRSPDKRKSFFGDLKSRLSFRSKSKKRTASEGRKAGDDVYHPPRAVSTPPSRDQSQTRYSTRAKSDMGSAGEVMSTTSSESLYHMSTLVVEVMQNHINKYYLVPPNMQKHPEARKIMKQGRKLHVFNEHLFSAVRVKTWSCNICPFCSGSTCGICNMRIAGSFGKQAYQCRDCRVVCHKRCHFKTDNYCENSTISKLEMYEPFYASAKNTTVVTLEQPTPP